MKNLIGKIFPIVLILCFIIDTISLYATGISFKAWTVFSTVSLAISSLSLAFVVFYIAIVKEDSLWAKIGMIGLLAYVVLTFGDIVIIKLFDKNVIKAYLFILKITSMLKAIVEALQYICIIELIIPKPKNSIVRIAKIAAMGFIAAYCLVDIGLVFGSVKLGTAFYKIRSTLSSLFKLCAYSALLLTVVAEEENKAPESTKVDVEKKDISSTPNEGQSLRNPATEELNAKIAAKEQATTVNQNVAQNPGVNQVTTPVSQPVSQPVQQSQQPVNNAPQVQNQNSQ